MGYSLGKLWGLWRGVQGVGLRLFMAKGFGFEPSCSGSLSPFEVTCDLGFSGSGFRVPRLGFGVTCICFLEG